MLDVLGHLSSAYQPYCVPASRVQQVCCLSGSGFPKSLCSYGAICLRYHTNISATERGSAAEDDFFYWEKREASKFQLWSSWVEQK